MISKNYPNPYPNKKITIPLTEEEIKYYKKIFELLDYEQKGKIKKESVFHFIRDSGLNDDILKQIFSFNFQKDQYYIDKNEFFIILRLVAMAQKKMTLSLQLIENQNLKLNLPSFSFLQRTNLLKRQNLFEISENEQKSYLKIFYDKRDTRKKYISKLSAFLVWNQLNPNAIKINENIMVSLEPLELKDYLNLKEFMVGCHLVYINRIIKMPIKLPENVLRYLGRSLKVYINNSNSNSDTKDNSNTNINTKKTQINNNINNNVINSNIKNNLSLGKINVQHGKNNNMNNQAKINNKHFLNQNQSNQIINKNNEQKISTVNNNNGLLMTNNKLINNPLSYNYDTEIDKMFNLVKEVKEKEAKYQLNSNADTNHTSNGNNSQNINQNIGFSQTFPSMPSNFYYINNYDNNYVNNLYESKKSNSISNSQYNLLQNNHFIQYSINNPYQTNSSFFK